MIAVAAGPLAGSSEPGLVIATASDGLLIFDGHHFRQVYPTDEAARRSLRSCRCPQASFIVMTIAATLLFDGKEIRELHPTLSNLYVETLAGNEVDLWVGTLNQGVRHWHAGTTDSFGEEQGLPDRQVQAIEIAGEKTYVGTPLGVAEFDGGNFSRTLGAGLLATSLLARGDELLVGTEEQGVVAVPLAKRRNGPGQQNSAELPEVRQLFAVEKETYALTRSGVFELQPHALGWKAVLKPDETVLSDRNISAGNGHADKCGLAISSGTGCTAERLSSHLQWKMNTYFV
jgi:hypothetical protein